jgi:nucleotide-binding universal stress UspA family protein
MARGEGLRVAANSNLRATPGATTEKEWRMTDALVEYDRGVQRPTNTESFPSGDPAEIGLALRHIAVPLDGSKLAECVLPYVVAITRESDARVTVLQVVEIEGAMSHHIDAIEWEMARAESHAYLTSVASRLQAEGVDAQVELVQGRAAEQITLFAKRQAVDLIVLATHGDGGAYAWTLGGTLQKVIAGAPTSMLIVPAADRPDSAPLSVRLRRMLLPLDCSQRAECILPAATELARRHDADLVLAHVVPEPEMPRRMGPSQEDVELAQQLVERNRRAAQRYLRDVQGRLARISNRVQVRLCVAPRPAQTLHELAQREGVDLVILSAHGSTGDVHQRYGAVAAEFLQAGYGPVIILQDLGASVRDERAPEAPRANHVGA